MGVAAFTLSLGLGQVRAADAPAEPIKVTNYGEKPQVTYDHAKHKEIACVDCHHNEADGKYKCGECHRAEAEGDVPKIKDAMHKKGAGKCRSCHFGKEATAKKLKCADCHAKVD